MADDSNTVGQREWGAMVETVRHLADAVEELKAQQRSDSEKLHTRLDELFGTVVHRHELEAVQSDVQSLWDHSRKTRDAVNAMEGGDKREHKIMDRLVKIGAVVLGVALGVAAKAYLG